MNCRIKVLSPSTQQGVLKYQLMYLTPSLEWGATDTILHTVENRATCLKWHFLTFWHWLHVAICQSVCFIQQELTWWRRLSDSLSRLSKSTMVMSVWINPQHLMLSVLSPSATQHQCKDLQRYSIHRSFHLPSSHFFCSSSCYPCHWPWHSHCCQDQEDQRIWGRCTCTHSEQPLIMTIPVGQFFSVEYNFRDFKFRELSLSPNQIVLNIIFLTINFANSPKIHENCTPWKITALR